MTFLPSFLPTATKAEIGDVVLAIGNPFAIGQTVTQGHHQRDGTARRWVWIMRTSSKPMLRSIRATRAACWWTPKADWSALTRPFTAAAEEIRGLALQFPRIWRRGIMVSLIQYGKVTRGYLGVRIQDITAALAKEFNLKSDQGALLGEVVPNGPADKAGLKDGDVILSFDGTPITDSRHLKLEVAGVAPGEKVPVEIVRDGSHKTVEVKLKELPGDEQMAKNTLGDNSQDNGTLQGVGVGDVNAEARQQFNIPENIKGAVVTEVAPDSASAQAGLKAGDVIMEINHHAVASADDAVKLTERPKDKVTLLRVWSGDGSHYIVVDESNKVG